MSILNKIWDPNKKILSLLEKKATEVASFEDKFKELTDEELRAKTGEFQSILGKIEDSIKKTERMGELLPEAYAVMREAMKRVWGERLFDVQIIGGIVLHQGKIAEMKTGEGKTIVAALPLYLNALSGQGVHLVTVNDYLSKHQGEGMGEVYNFLGLSTGVIQSNQESFRFVKQKDYKHYSECDGSNLEPCTRAEAYASDITYGTNNEFGFDYLRDNMAPTLEYCVQRSLYFAIVDEVDSILIDEARTPLIISAQAEESTSMYQQFAALVPQLVITTDYIVDEKDRSVNLTDAGIKKMEKLLNVKNIYETGSISMVHHLEQALKANMLFKRDKDYIVKEGEIVIVDEFTGRLMQGRRYSEGLHQAIEAKEGVEVKNESQTMATISFQNLFRMYDKLSGMTGTAATEAEEFYKIYKLDVVEIPTNRPVVRKDFEDRIYKNEEAKLNALVADIAERQKAGQPVLIGTVSVEKNEELSKLLKKSGIKHEVLNAKNHGREAKIIMKAGQKGAVTVATNMAGRGTDIKLGEGVAGVGGLHVIGTDRHESRRIDNQLRGRAGRQGDPGSSLFYTSMDDDLMRIFGGDRMKNLMNSLGLPEDMPIENKLISRSIESAQRKVEGHNFDIRKHLVDYDDVMNKHREVIYRKRRGILESKDEKAIKEEILGIINDQIEHALLEFVEDETAAKQEICRILNLPEVNTLDSEELKEMAIKVYEGKEEKAGAEVMANIAKAVYLRTIDMLWVEHLTTMDELRTGIGLRGYGQRDPLVEYKQEAYRMYQSLISNIESAVAANILRVEVRPNITPIRQEKLNYISSEDDSAGDNSGKSEVKAPLEEVAVTMRKAGKTVYDRMNESSGAVHSKINNNKVGRNDPCPCGSGKKYKKCHGR